MKKFIKAITAGAFSIVLALSAAASTAVLNADAASMGDVISKAREIGMPESEIQGYISQYGGRDYTSDQYQQAVNALEGMRGKYSGGNSGNNSSDETNATLFPEDTTANATEATNSKEVDDFLNKSSEDKIKYITGLTDDEAKKFWNELTDEQKKTVGEVLNADKIDDLKKSAEKAAAELGISIATTEDTTESTEETTETETESVSESEAETESETAEVIAKTTNTMIWVVVCVILGVAVIFAIIAYVMKKSNKKE